MHSLKRKMAIGVVWTASFKLARRGLGLISTLILARLLVPADFGLVALATAIIGAFELLTAFNFEIALIQNQSAEKKHYDTAWTFNVLFGIVIAVGLVVFADSAAQFFREPRLGPVLMVLAVSFAIQSTSNIAVVDLQKELRFAEDFKLRAMQQLARFSVTLPMAFWLKSYWALIIGMLVGSIAKVVLTYWTIPYKPSFTLVARRELIGFSSWLLANRILAFLRNRSTELFLGRLAGVQALGLFTVAYEISNLPTTEVVAPINRAVMPGYSRMAKNLELIRESYLEVICLIAIFALPAGIGVAATAHLLVPVLLGDKWIAAVPVIQVLAVYGALNALLANSAPLFNAIGKPYLITITQGISIAVLVPIGIALAASNGALGLAWAYLIVVPITILLTIFVAMRELKLRVTEFVRVLWRPVLASVAMFAAVTQLFPDTDYVGGELVVLASSMFLAIACGILTYVAADFLLWRLSGRPDGAETIILARIPGIRRRLFRR